MDNIRHDVLISPVFINDTSKLVYRLMSHHAGIEKKGLESLSGEWPMEVDNYKQIYKELMLEAINKAKLSKQISIVYLAQTAVFKILLDGIRAQYDTMIGQLKKTVRQTDLCVYDYNSPPEESYHSNVNLRKIHLDRAIIEQKVGKDMCGFWADIEQNEIQPMLEAIFGCSTQLFENLLINPILHTQQYDNSFIMLNEYDLCLGRRTNDPDKYEALIFLVRQIINAIGLYDPSFSDINIEQRSNPSLSHDKEDTLKKRRTYNEKIEGIIQDPENMELLFNWLQTKADYRNLKKQNASKSELIRLKNLMKNQKKLLNYLYKQFKRKGLIELISASYEMQPEHLKYCPPLNPQQIAQYLVSSKTRKAIKKRLKRINQNYQQVLSLRPLNKKIKLLKNTTDFKHKIFLIRFLKAFARYHRDINNFRIIQDCMEQVNIATEDKIINLSRVNNTLYQFLLPHERPPEKAAIINHVVVKADVRGSTDITYQMNKLGLNPASYFSLNFFDPISEILSEYDATKNFIEGDAVILSIFEYENAPAGWFCASKACSIALNILMIIRRYNEKSQKFQLPILELGIGISYSDKVPAFLFDQANRIMISSAINQADRLSRCSKAGIRLFVNQNSLFNLYVFQAYDAENMTDGNDDLYLRYNVNGIELNAEGFKKLSNEIDLKLLKGTLTDINELKSNFYTGKFPTKSGYYQRLLIRESQIPIIDTATFKVKDISSHKYYEVCSNPKLYQWADKF
ncbi:MAG: hypothetical protein KJ882_07195 [Proteobacteria bacterium]|nr:hypothetical protein [Pseudomonadota bacterium]MBU4010536.1 hypothetical protein [Pseudomonadota bacterium]